jgi:hypothetical protein
MKRMTSSEMHEAVRKALVEVDRRLASGELDGSGRYFTDAELAAGAATGEDRKPAPPAEATAA